MSSEVERAGAAIPRAHQRFSLLLLFGWVTAFSVCIGAYMAVWSQLSGLDVFFRLCYSVAGMIGTITTLLVLAAALSPWLPTPSRLQAARQEVAPRDGVLASALMIALTWIPTLGALGFALLVASRWDGESQRSMGEIGFDWFFVIFATLGGLLAGAASSKLLALYAGSPLGRLNKYLFGALLSGLVYCQAFILAMIFPGVFGIIGLIIMLLICETIRRCDPRVTGFTVRARIWSARGALGGAAVSAALWWIAVYIEMIQPADYFPRRRRYYRRRHGDIIRRLAGGPARRGPKWTGQVARGQQGMIAASRGSSAGLLLGMQDRLGLLFFDSLQLHNRSLSARSPCL